MPLILPLELGKGREEVGPHEPGHGGRNYAADRRLIIARTFEGLDSENGFGAQRPASTEWLAIIPRSGDDYRRRGGSGISVSDKKVPDVDAKK